MKRGTLSILILCMIMIMIPCVTASDWQIYGKREAATGFQDPTYTGNMSVVGSFDEYTDGNDMQPLVADFDNDGDVEIWTHEGNFIKILNINLAGEVELEFEHNIGDDDLIMPWSGDIDGDGYIEVVTYINGVVETIFTFEYDGVSLDWSVNASLTGITARSGMMCDDFSGTYGCYFAHNTGNLSEYNPVTGGHTIVNLDIASGFAWGDVILSRTVPPAFFDIDNDGNTEMAFLADVDADDDEGVVVIDQNSLSLDTGFSGDGIIDDIGTPQDAHVQGVLMANIDGSGTGELCLTYITDSGLDKGGFLVCYNSDGSAYGSPVVVDDTGNNEAFAIDTFISPPILADVDGAGQREICVGCLLDLGPAANDYEQFFLTCHDPAGGTISAREFDETWGATSTFNTAYFGNNKITAADMDNDGCEDILAGRRLFISNCVNTFSGISISDEREGEPVPADMDGDGVLDVVAVNASYIQVSVSNASNNPPVLNNTLQSGGYLGYYMDSPTCKDTTITFTAAQTGTNRNYDNDVDVDQERLHTDCGQGGSSVNGSFSAAFPDFSCFYNETGTYSVTIYIQDNVNPADFTQSNTEAIIVNVIDGVPGLTCNDPSELVTSVDDLEVVTEATTAAQAAAAVQEQSIADLRTILSGADDGLAIIIGLSIMIFLGVVIAQRTRSWQMGIVGMVMGAIISMFLTFFDVWVMLLILISMIAVWLFTKVIFKGDGGGGG